MMTKKESRRIDRCLNNIKKQIQDVLDETVVVNNLKIVKNLKGALVDVEEIKTYMVDRGSGRYVELSNKIEKVLIAADVHLVDIVRYLIDDCVDSNSDEELFEENCIALAIYQMMLKSRENIATLIHLFRDKETFELRFLGALVEELLLIEHYVEEHSKTLNKLNIDSEKILGKLYGVISPLKHFLWEHIPSIKQ